MIEANVVILAAGRGKRMHSDKPKVLHTIAGKALLAHVVDSAKLSGIQKILVVYGHGGEAVPQAFAQHGTQFVLQEPQLGTGHAVQQAIPHLQNNSTTLILYGDVPLIQTSTIKKMLGAHNQLTLLTATLDNPAGYGRIVRDQNGNITRIVEDKDCTPAQKLIQEINTGIMAAPTHLLRAWLAKLNANNAQGEYYLTDVVAMAVADGVPVQAQQPSHPWEVMGVNSKAQLAALERAWQAEQAQQLLEQGVTLADPARVDIRGKLTCGRDVEIDIGCIFEGDVSLGDNVKVGAYSIIKNADIGNASLIHPYSHIEQSKVGANCRIGPYARIRPGSKLHNEVHIGNFVEIKNSEIAAGSKANHLSYIGDSNVGSQVNIGAGTITCNYDGANKYRTVIEDGVFIGSATQLIAPVTIGRNATIGAGSTITRDAPEDALTLSRAKQTTVAGWKRPSKKR